MDNLNKCRCNLVLGNLGVANMTTVAIHQPNYIPWIGYFDKIAHTDIFVFLDSVEYSHGGVTNRNKIRNSSGWNWLTVPVNKKDTNKSICEVGFADDKWWKKHLTALQGSYSKADHFSEYASYFYELYSEKKYDNIADLNIDIIKYLSSSFGISTKYVRSSEMNIDPTLHKNSLLIEILQKLNADTYIAGKGCVDYMDDDKFIKNGIEVVYNNFKPFVYKQRWDGFEPYMSAVDLLFNEGDKSGSYFPHI